jgi:hypothetical protein
MSSGVLIVVIAAGLSALVQIFTDPRITKVFVVKSLVALAVYAAHIAIGGAVMVYLIPHRPEAAVGAIVAFLGWVGLGMLGLIRFAPRLREPPRMLLQFGIADGICLAMIAGGVASAAGLL